MRRWALLARQDRGNKIQQNKSKSPMWHKRAEIIGGSMKCVLGHGAE